MKGKLPSGDTSVVVTYIIGTLSYENIIKIKNCILFNLLFGLQVWDWSF